MHHKKVLIAGILATLVVVLLAAVMSQPAVVHAQVTWTAQYWNNRDLIGPATVQRQEGNINYDWGEGSPANEILADNFSARWEATVNLPAGTYRFTATMDDGMRVYVNSGLLIDDWAEGPVRTRTADITLPAGGHTIVVDYFEATGGARAQVSWAPVSTGVPTNTPVPVDGWLGEYFNNINLSGSPVVTRIDPQIDFTWGNGAPLPGMPPDQFSVRWTRNLTMNNGRYRFDASSDDGIRVWVNNQLIIDAWVDRALQTSSAEVTVPGGSIPVRVEYYDRELVAEVRVIWTQIATDAPTATPVPPPPTATPIPPLPTGVPPTAGTGVNLNVRSGPGTNFPVVGQVRVGSTVYLAGYRNANTTWIMIILPDGGHGWMAARYLQSSIPFSSLPVWTGTTTAPPAATAVPGSSATGTIVNASYLNVRIGPGVEHRVITTIARGTVVQLGSYRNAAGNWVQVVLPSGAVGWINANYLSTTFPINTLPVWNG